MLKKRYKYSFISLNYFKQIYYKKLSLNNLHKNNILFIFNKNQHLFKLFNQNYIYIHKGNVFKKLYINKYNLGYKFLDFTFTKKPFFFPEKKKKSGKR